MKRSEINAVIKKFEALLAEYKFALPPYLSFTPEEWAEKSNCPLTHWSTAPDIGRFTKIAPNPIGSSRLGSMSFAMAR